MTKTPRNMLGAAALGAIAAAAPAAGQSAGDFLLGPNQAVTGLYVGAGVGLNLSENSTLRTGAPLRGALTGLGIRPDGRAVFEPGFVGLGSVGWGFGNGLRLEVEGQYRENDVDKVSGFRGAGFANSAAGTQRIYGVMANALLDFRIPGVSWFIPYVGGGIGYAWREWDGVRSVSPAGGFTLRSGGVEGGFAWQAIGGAAFPVAAVPGLAITAEYRYFGMESGTFQSPINLTATNARLLGGPVRSESVANHSVLLGLRYAFNAPTPAPAPAPMPVVAPAPARTFLVFFDWDRSDLTDRARQIVGEAASSARTVGSTRIEVQGHADRTGSAAYNQRLSMRRGEAVAAELVRRGVNRSDIGVQGFGFDRPLVPTAMGVREPQNRRVEIILR